MRRLASACAAILLLSGCQSTPEPIEPSAPPTRPASNAHEPNSTAKPPTLPEIAKRNDETGAANFVVYWVKVSDYASLTGDTAVLRSISEPSCEGCRSYISLYEETYGSGGFIKGGLERLEDISVERGSHEQFVRARAISTPGQFKPSSRAPIQKTPPESVVILYAAKFADQRWRLTQIGLDN